MNIAVYLGSSFGNSEKLIEKCEELGAFIGKNGHNLVYGGSECGLMGVIAKSVLKNGGKVFGVEPKYFIDMGFAFAKNEITELYVVDTMAERKTKMIELADAFITFPGGTGTVEELGEIMAHVGIPETPDYIDGLCIIYNIDGYWDGIKQVLDKMVEYGFSTKEKQKQIFFAENLEEIEDILYNKNGGDL